ncbi:MAG: C1 family peptidase [Chloroflexota bacterium]
MSRLSPNDRTFNPLPFFVAVIAVILVVAAPTFAQLTQDDIDRLREQGKREGWTFEVRLCDFNSTYPLEQVCGMVEPPDAGSMAPASQRGRVPLSAAPPSSWDWRELGGVTPVKNQGSCGSCWAFGTVGAVESAIKIMDGLTVDLSEQWLVSCNTQGYDCGGGWYVFDYFLAEGRLDLCGETGGVLEPYFPYVAYNASCNCPYPRSYWIDNWGYIGPSNQVAPTTDIKTAIMQWGPVAVSVYVNDAWYAYGGGIFNACQNFSVNHSVVIVGWDDNYENSGIGVWIVKNSWGTGWGDHGYIYIPYGCSKIGYATTYVDYGQQGVYFYADTTVGWIPLTANFESFSALPVDSWYWTFGDGSDSYDEFPSHTYTQNGSYDVTLQITSGTDVRTITKEMYIIAIADTIRGDTLTTMPGTQVELVVNANNSAPINYLKIPFEFGNTIGMVYDSFSTVGCRTSYFEVQTELHWDLAAGKRATLKLLTSEMETSPDLPPGSGPVVKLYFTVPDASTMPSL